MAAFLYNVQKKNNLVPLLLSFSGKFLQRVGDKAYPFFKKFDLKPDTNGSVIAALAHLNNSVYLFDTRKSLAGAWFKSLICTSYCIHYISHFHCLGKRKSVIDFPSTTSAGSIKFSPVKPRLIVVGTLHGPEIYDLRTLKYDIDLI